MSFLWNLLGLIPILGILLALGGSIHAARKRFENLGKNPNLGWLVIVPLANIWAGFNCIVYPPGYAYHKKLDTAAKVIIGLYILMIVVGIAGAVFLFSSMPQQY